MRTSDNLYFGGSGVSQVSLAAQLGELRGQIEGLKGRIDDMHRLLMLLIILVLQLLK